MPELGHKLKIAILSSVLGLTACGAPPGVPADAAFEFGKESQWTWQRSVGAACADWGATEDYASVLLYSSQCEIGPHVWYLTGTDSVAFNGYWRGPSEVAAQPRCDVGVSPAQIAELRRLVETLLTQDITDAEARVLRRVDQRLAATNGAALTEALGGCAERRPVTDESQNVWRVRA